MTKPIQFRLPEDLIKLLDEEAKRESRSRNKMLEHLLWQYFNDGLTVEQWNKAAVKFSGAVDPSDTVTMTEAYKNLYACSKCSNILSAGKCINKQCKK